MQSQRDYDAAQARSGRKTWSSPCIASISVYLRQRWQHFTAMGTTPCADLWLLNDLQELQLWQRVVRQNFDGALLAPEAAAREAMQAYRNLALWSCDLTTAALQKRFELNDDSAFFHRCATAFKQLCEQESCISETDAIAVLAKLPSPTCARIVLYGFDELVPAYRALFELWDVPLEQAQPGGRAGDRWRVSCDTERAEFACAAAWAEQSLRSDASACVGIIVPELQTQRAAVEYEFAAHFEPNYFRPETARYVLPFNISAGLPLADVPLVQSALLVLQLNSHTLATEELASLLYSPFLAVERDSLAARITLEQRLRSYQDASLNLGTLLYQCSSRGLKGGGSQLLCPALANAVQQFKQLRSGGQKTLPRWLDLFEAQLATFGWPGERTLDSVEYQQLQRWHEALEVVCTLANLTGKLSLGDALHSLRQVLTQTVFQPQSATSPIQILGVLEGAGLSFTHLWICGLSSKTWPPVARPSALIPLLLQRELNMPHCGPEREYEVARRLLQSYTVNSGTIVLSHARQQDQQVLEPSALIAEVAEVSLEQLLPNDSGSRPVEARPALEIISSDKAPPVQAGEVLRGGVSIYANQAACPFRAFATHRLQASGLQTPCTGLSPLQRGILVHHCLDYVWRTLGSQELLRRKTAQQVQAIISAAIDDALTAVAKNLQAVGVQALLELERARLQMLLSMWLDYETRRPPFVVKHCEYELEVDVAGRPRHLRIDRIDELEDGTQLLIDYKTGVVSAVGWRGEPLQDPQLPLYTLQLNARNAASVSGIVLARVDSHEPKWVGIGSGAEAGFLQNAGRARQDETSWDDYLQSWQAAISALDFAFSEGEAAVSPLHGHASCSYCDLKPLCRIPKRQLENDVEEGANNER